LEFTKKKDTRASNQKEKFIKTYGHRKSRIGKNTPVFNVAENGSYTFKAKLNVESISIDIEKAQIILKKSENSLATSSQPEIVSSQSESVEENNQMYNWHQERNSLFEQGPIFRAPIEMIPESVVNLNKEAYDLYKKMEYRASTIKYSKSFKALGNKGTKYDRYNAACSWALAGEIDSSFVQLIYIVKYGNYTNYDHITNDKDLFKLHTDLRWDELMRNVKENKKTEENKPLDYGYGSKDTATVSLGTQEWISKNLNVSTFANGDAILQVKSREEWDLVLAEKLPAWAYYNFDSKNGDLYGKLYNRYAVYDNRGLSPSGWHIPSYHELWEMFNHLGGYEQAAQLLKSKTGWVNNGNSGNSNGFDAVPGGWMNNGNGLNRNGFDALPGGRMYTVGGQRRLSYDIGQIGCWWTTTRDGTLGKSFFMHNGHNRLMTQSANSSTFLSVRVLRPSKFAIDYGYGLSDAFTRDIGTQRWMSKNLNLSTFSNGDSIFEAKTKEEWLSAADKGLPAYCNYNFSSDVRFPGKLYNWYAVNDPRGLAPKGSHIPNDDEWNLLVTYLGGENSAGLKMKSTYGWKKYNNGNLSYGFNGTPAGQMGEGFSNLTDRGFWWSSTESSNGRAWFRSIHWFDNIAERGNQEKMFGYSVRCIID
jgi:uncharacterized protein (TIGR02145 family)